LICNPVEGGPGPEEVAEQYQRWVADRQEFEDAGLLVANNGLQGADAATTEHLVGDVLAAHDRLPARAPPARAAG
jgi:hypothetical protein